MTTSPSAVITGASTGNGLELARELVAGRDAIICGEGPQFRAFAGNLLPKQVNARPHSQMTRTTVGRWATRARTAA